MKFSKHSKQIITLLAIVAVFSTVTTETVSAKEVELITNFVYSSQSTGGTTSRGADGQDGEDGQDGQAGKSGVDGQPGSDGGSSVSIDSGVDASIHIESTVDGVKVVDIERTNNVTGSSSVAVVIQTTASTDSGAEVEITLDSSSDETTAQYSFATIQDAFYSLRSIILKYVSYLL